MIIKCIINAFKDNFNTFFNNSLERVRFKYYSLNSIELIHKPFIIKKKYVNELKNYKNPLTCCNENI